MEEPLAIALAWRDSSGNTLRRVFTVTMRTPGNDAELALGLLLSEGVIRRRDDITAVHREPGEEGSNEIEITLTAGIVPDWARYDRNLATQSSCGVCGKTSLQALALKDPPTADSTPGWLDPALLPLLPGRLRDAQALFRETGGVHAAGLFDDSGELLVLREDVGRHNALDKLVGTRLESGGLAGGPCILVLSGRASFELLQKAVMAAIPVVVAVGAPSSLAVRVAQQHDITLAGFASDTGFSIYHGAQRLR